MIALKIFSNKQSIVLVIDLSNFQPTRQRHTSSLAWQQNVILVTPRGWSNSPYDTTVILEEYLMVAQVYIQIIHIPKVSHVDLKTSDHHDHN
jgi:hypothetical protein